MSKYNDYITRITEANKYELNIITFELCINYINDAIETIESDENAFSRNVETALSFLREIMVSLDLSYEISYELLEIYLYVNKLLIEGNIKKNKQNLLDAVYMLTNIKEGFLMIENTDNEKVMKNTSKVFAGLTYGRDGSLTEYIDNSPNRGFKA